MYELYLNKAHAKNSILSIFLGFPDSLVSKESACRAGDLGSIPGSGRVPGEGNGNLFQHSCLENPMGREEHAYSPWGHKETDTIERLTLHLPT